MITVFGGYTNRIRIYRTERGWMVHFDWKGGFKVSHRTFHSACMNVQAYLDQEASRRK